MGTGQRLAFAAVAAIIAVVAVVALSSSGEPDRPAASTGSQGASASATPTAAAAPERVAYRDGAVQGGLAKLTFKKGERARFSVSSDVADEVHVHGYDIHEDVAAGGTASFSFPATIEGVFEVELEGRGEQLAQLRVEP